MNVNNKNNLNLISKKFKFDIQNEKCWYYIKDKEIAVDKDLTMTGMYSGQKIFGLDPNNKDHWVSCRITYFSSKNKVYIDFWYKKRMEDNGKVWFLHYKKRMEKLVDIIEIEFTDVDEQIKVLNEAKQKHLFVNRLEWESKNKNNVIS